MKNELKVFPRVSVTAKCIHRNVEPVVSWEGMIVTAVSPLITHFERSGIFRLNRHDAIADANVMAMDAVLESGVVLVQVHNQ